MTPRRDYPDMLGLLEPAQAVTILNEHVKRIGRINTEIADWIQERRKIEGLYVQGLRKLARRPPSDDASELGTFLTPWQKITSATEFLASSHETLAQRIEVDVERPLREFIHKNRDMQALSTVQGNLASMAREIESASEKADKLKKKGKKAAPGKVANAAAELEAATSQWNSQAPFVFENLQVVDESRLNLLRDALTQFQTHEVDQVERNRTTAEECLNALLNVETADEIGSFVARMISGKAKAETQSTRTTVTTALSPPASSALFDDTASQRSGVSAGPARTEPAHESRSDRFGGLRRLGTVMTRRKSAAATGRSPSPSKRPSDPYVGLEKSPEEIPPLPTIGESKGGFAPLFSDEDNSNLKMVEPSKSSQDTSRQPPTDVTNGEVDDITHMPTTGLKGRTNSSDSNDNKELPKYNPDTGIESGEQRKRSELVSPTLRDDPISKAENEASNESAQNPLRLDIRNDPIQEEDDEAQSAMANVANTLRAQATQSRKPGTARGRRDVRNTIFVPSPPAPVSGSNDSPALFPPSRSGRTGPAASDDQAGSETQSIRSSRSVSSVNVPPVVKHPDMLGMGLNSSVVETVSASFDQGRVTKATVIGEMAVSYNATDSSTTLGLKTVRLENFPVLEKVAPNPTFVESIPGRSGEYTINLRSITRTSVAFKYQVHLDDANFAAHAPILIAPSWKTEPTQASVILNYSLSPSLGLSQGQPLTLHNLILIIHLDGARPSSCQSKPVGTFSRERSLILWQLGDVTLEAGAAPLRLLARFVTNVQAKPGSVEARWEISSEDATGLGSQLTLSELEPSMKNTALSREPQDDPFADDGGRTNSANIWKTVPTVRRLVSGTYVAT